MVTRRPPNSQERLEELIWHMCLYCALALTIGILAWKFVKLAWPLFQHVHQ